ncbi:MAG TPA: hypothetical protein VFG54_16830 [Prolixibacteraceae bacterium]|nr:hypothetical protein [Prolixibacteraceae bacterium]
MKRNLGELVSGKIGNVVFYQRYGKSYVRAAPTKKQESWTKEQLLYRQRLKKASALWRSVKSDEMSRIWNTAAELMNGYAWFMKANMPALAMDGTLIDAKLLKVADGKLPLPQNLKAERMPDDSYAITISWQNDPHCNAERLKDEIRAMSYAEGKFSKIISTNLKRSDLQGTYTLPAKPANASHVYLFMTSENGEGYSESVCFEI